jgi:chaperonin GroES
MAKTNLKPLDDRVIIEQSEAEETTAGGIVLPDTAKEKPQRGKVLAVGPGRLLNNGKRGPVNVKVGEEVFYSKYAGSDVEIGDKKYVILRERDILAIIGK